MSCLEKTGLIAKQCCQRFAGLLAVEQSEPSVSLAVSPIRDFLNHRRFSLSFKIDGLTFNSYSIRLQAVFLLNNIGFKPLLYGYKKKSLTKHNKARLPVLPALILIALVNYQLKRQFTNQFNLIFKPTF